MVPLSEHVTWPVREPGWLPLDLYQPQPPRKPQMSAWSNCGTAAMAAAGRIRPARAGSMHK